MPKGLFKNKAAEHKAQLKNEKKKAKRLELKYALRPNTLQDFEFAINQRYGPDDGSKTPPGFQARNTLFESMLEFKVDDNTPKNDQKF